MRIDVLIGVLVCLMIIGIPIIGICLERKDFNNGICPLCGTNLRYFDSDSQGGRGYCCDNCSYRTWVSWNTVDKIYWKNKEAKHND